MAAGDIKIEYAASSALTITLASLATDADLAAGRESTLVDNTTNKYLDYILGGFITTGTSPTVNKTILVCVAGILNDTTWGAPLDGTDSDEDFVSANARNAACVATHSIPVTATSDVTYTVKPISIASCFGGVLPKKFVVFVVHDTAVNLNATAGNHGLYVTPVYSTVAQS